MTLGEKIKQLRKDKDLSLEKFGKLTGIHPRLIGKYENNTTEPSADKLRKIAKILGISADYLLFDDAPKSRKIKVKDPELLEKFILLDAITDKEKNMIKDIIDAIILKSQIKKFLDPNKKVITKDLQLLKEYLTDTN